MVTRIVLQADDSKSTALARRYHDEFKEKGIEVLVDDREESPGRKFKDADLIGIPYRVVIGKRGLKDGNVEIKSRKGGELIVVKKEELQDKLINIL